MALLYATIAMLTSTPTCDLLRDAYQAANAQGSSCCSGLTDASASTALTQITQGGPTDLETRARAYFGTLLVGGDASSFFHPNKTASWVSSVGSYGNAYKMASEAEKAAWLGSNVYANTDLTSPQPFINPRAPDSPVINVVSQGDLNDGKAIVRWTFGFTMKSGRPYVQPTILTTLEFKDGLLIHEEEFLDTALGEERIFGNTIAKDIVPELELSGIIDISETVGRIGVGAGVGGDQRGVTHSTLNPNHIYAATYLNSGMYRIDVVTGEIVHFPLRYFDDGKTWIHEPDDVVMVNDTLYYTVFQEGTFNTTSQAVDYTRVRGGIYKVAVTGFNKWIPERVWVGEDGVDVVVNPIATDGQYLYTATGLGWKPGFLTAADYSAKVYKLDFAGNLIKSAAVAEGFLNGFEVRDGYIFSPAGGVGNSHRDTLVTNGPGTFSVVKVNTDTLETTEILGFPDLPQGSAPTCVKFMGDTLIVSTDRLWAVNYDSSSQTVDKSTLRVAYDFAVTDRYTGTGGRVRDLYTVWKGVEDFVLRGDPTLVGTTQWLDSMVDLGDLGFYVAGTKRGYLFKARAFEPIWRADINQPLSLPPPMDMDCTWLQKGVDEAPAVLGISPTLSATLTASDKTAVINGPLGSLTGAVNYGIIACTAGVPHAFPVGVYRHTSSDLAFAGAPGLSCIIQWTFYQNKTGHTEVRCGSTGTLTFDTGAVSWHSTVPFEAIAGSAANKISTATGTHYGYLADSNTGALSFENLVFKDLEYDAAADTLHYNVIQGTTVSLMQLTDETTLLPLAAPRPDIGPNFLWPSAMFTRV